MLLNAKKKKVIFVDWFGVVSRDVFWKSIITNYDDELCQFLSDRTGQIFQNQKLVNNWMKGNISCQNVVKFFLAPDTDLGTQNKLLSILLNDCKMLHHDSLLLNQLNTYRKFAYIVLATDNMDCFIDQLKKTPLIYFFDFILCSSEIGFLKAEKPEMFFGSFLKENQLQTSDSILIDDSFLNCLKFKNFGGDSVLYDESRVSSILQYLDHWINN